MLYKTLKTANSSQDPWEKFVWKNRGRRRELDSLYGYFHREESSAMCKTKLIEKRIVGTTVCDICQAAEETPAHVIFGCTTAQEFWEAIQIETQAAWPVQKLHEIRPPEHILSKHFGTFMLLYAVSTFGRGGTVQCSGKIWLRYDNRSVGGVQVRSRPMESSITEERHRNYGCVVFHFSYGNVNKICTRSGKNLYFDH